MLPPVSVHPPSSHTLSRLSASSLLLPPPFLSLSPLSPLSPLHHRTLHTSRPSLGGSKFYLGNKKDFNQWEQQVPPKLQNVVRPIGRGQPALSSKYIQVDDGSGGAVQLPRKLRGTGLHGPENGDVLRLVLWNRLKQRRPQREVPTLGELQEWYKMEVGIRWFLWSVILVYAPMAVYGKSYAMKHDHYPWVPARTDGSRGEGCLYWWAIY
eukprot:GHVQ01035684.1.p1 GENE.GHVQ01035684.1~~GHVQ01035684.1.p1  ORF type:complete len:210 (-),score=41.41 GHVQ01035684.1:149-778(-)